MRTWHVMGWMALAAMAEAGASSRVMTPVDLRCEFRSEPLGVDEAQPRLSWVLEADAGAKNLRQTHYRILVASSRANLSRNLGDLWDTGRVVSTRQNNIVYAGAPLKAGKAYFWKVWALGSDGKSAWSKAASWETGLMGDGWKALWIDDGKPIPTAPEDFYKDDPAPLFRKEFRVRGPISRARLYITGLGYYEASLNGSRIGDHVLDPGWTRFDKRVNYSVYDVGKLLKPGSNCLGAVVGNGWFNPLPLKLFGSFNLRDQLPTGRPRFIAQLHIDYRDGTSETIMSDGSWKTGEGPILRNNIYLGEVYDARLEQPGWNKPGFDDSAWKSPRSAGKAAPLIAQPQPPVRSTATWHAVETQRSKSGSLIVDMGVNFAGWVQLNLNVAKGTKLVLRYGELLRPDGSLNPMTSVAGQIKGVRQGTQESVGGPGAPAVAVQSDTYIAKGGGETYTPRFTWHGFRYVEVEGLTGDLPLTAITAHRLNSDVADAGEFSCSNPLLDQIQTLCERTFKSNIFSVQSDCPHRERFGYGGDIVATSEAFMANYDMANFYEKVVRDWTDSARPDGMFTDTAPFVGIQYCGVIWAMAHPLLIDQLYQYYGDRRIGEREYTNARRWLLLVDGKYPDGIVTEGLSDHESLVDTPAPDLVTPAYFASAKLLAEQARRLGKASDAERFEALARKIQAAYAAKFIDADTGKVGLGSQAAQAFALYTGIAPETSRNKILEYLLADIEKHKGHLTTGILGTKFMLDVLSREGHVDVAYRIATQPDFPGWGWMLKNGATTLWEHWEFSDNTFSHNHPMFGSISQWMMQCLGGIRPAADADGYDRIVIAPHVPTGLDWVKSSYRSVRGKIVSNWKRTSAGISYEIVVPPNTSARVMLAGKEPFDLGSGSYRFAGR